MLSRRDFIHSGCAIAAVQFEPHFMDKARAWTHGASNAPSRRSVLNTNSLNVFDYSFIDHFAQQDEYGPVGAAWATGTVWNKDILDAHGYPNNAANGRNFGGGIRVPASANFAGPYILKGRGRGTFRFPASQATYTVNTGASSGVTVNGNGNWSVTDPYYIVFNYTGPRLLLSYFISATDPLATGDYLRDFHWMRQVDETDFDAGKIFRAPWKQSILDGGFSALRVMDWNDTNGSMNCRYENRTPMGYVTYSGVNWNASPAYTDTSGNNALTLSGATGTPVTPQHGEVVNARIGAGGGFVRCNNIVVTAISKANPGVVTATAHGFNTGDVVIFPDIAGMTQLNWVPCTITLDGVDPTNKFSIGIDTSAFTTFTSGRVVQFVTLNVAGRGAAPIIWGDASKPASYFGNTFCVAGDYYAFVYDKTIAGQADTSGNWTMGAWVFTSGGQSTPFQGAAPLEICTIAVNEINAMGPAKVLDLWYTLPAMGMLSMDPDYSSGSNFATNGLAQLLNGGGGYPALLHSAKIWVELSNETWNPGFTQTPYYGRRGFFRWLGNGGSISDFGSYAALRSMVMVSDIQGAVGSSRIKFVMGGQQVRGVSGLNSDRITGSTFVLNDPGNTPSLNPSHTAPMTVHDAFAVAEYVTISGSTWENANLTTLAATWAGNAGNAVAQEANCATYAANMITDPGGGNSQYINFWTGTLLPAYRTALLPFNKTVIGYEGNWDKDTTPTARIGTLSSGSANITSIDNSATIAVGSYVFGLGIPDGTTVLSSSAGAATMSNNATYTGIVAFSACTQVIAFLLAVKRSQAWADAWLLLLNAYNSQSNVGMPATFVEVSPRYGDIALDTYGRNYTSSTEYSDLALAWQAMATRNLSLSP